VILRGTGSRSFAAASSDPTRDDVEVVAVGDFDRDGRTDLVLHDDARTQLLPHGCID
jgi:hypothetical protein